MKKNTYPKLSCIAALFIITSSTLFAQTSGHSFSKAKPALQWKYGWQDGRLANTIGRFRGGNILPSASSYTSSGYSPAQVAHAYGFDQINPSGDGRGQIIAIIDAYGSANIQSDLNTFCTHYGLPSTTVNVAYPLGKPAAQDSGWAGETALDVEWAHAMAPGATIVLVVSPDADTSSLIAAVNYAANTLKASVVSMSWGATEFYGENSYDSSFNKSGVTFVASAGDSGGVVNWPASSPFVLSVGGTRLLYNASSGTIAAETAWNSGGGGVSQFENLPSYQAGWNVNAGRGTPDVSYNADPYTGVSVFFTDPTLPRPGGWYIFGGTSAGAPQWSALIARRASLGNVGNTSFQTLLYGTAKTSAASYAALLRDITTGNNGYPAVTGYDLATGLGSPLAAKIALLPSVLPTPTPSPTATPAPSPTPTPVPNPTATPTPKPSPTPKPTPPPSRWWGGRWFNR